MESEARVVFPGKGPTGRLLHPSSTQVFSADGVDAGSVSSASLQRVAGGRAEKGHCCFAAYVLAAEIDKKYGNDLFVCFVVLR